jgi:DNA-binding CsgD family transcriptional regulator
LALIRLQAGDPDACRRELEAAGGPEFAEVEPGTRYALYEAMTQAELARGDLARAEEWALRAEAAGALPPVSAGRVLRSRAAVLLAAGDAGGATRLAQVAADRAGAAGARVEAARSLALAGTGLARSGHRELAVAALSRANDEFADCGANRDADQAVQELRLLGERQPGRRRPAAGMDPVGDLSGRELEVARLVAAGKTNREISAALCISVKTVEGHLRRVFEKLDVRSRAGVAAAVERSRATQGVAGLHQPPPPARGDHLLHLRWSCHLVDGRGRRRRGRPRPPSRLRRPPHRGGGGHERRDPLKRTSD